MPSTRDRILDAAAEVIAKHGLARATTKEIARATGLSEAMLYKHFEGKHDLFLHVLLERLPALSTAITALPGRVGESTVQLNLEDVATAAIDFYIAGFPMATSMFSEIALLKAFQSWLAERDTGPHEPVNAVARYLQAERDIGRVRPEADATAAAALLMGACFHRALLLRFTDNPPTSDGEREAAHAFVSALCESLMPDGATAGE